MVNKTRIAALLLLPVILLPAAGCARNKVKGDTAYVARVSQAMLDHDPVGLIAAI